MKIGKEQFELINQQIQHFSGAAAYFDQNAEATPSGELFEEFSRILDKIASTVNSITENQTNSYWLANREIFAPTGTQTKAPKENKDIKTGQKDVEEEVDSTVKSEFKQVPVKSEEHRQDSQTGKVEVKQVSKDQQQSKTGEKDDSLQADTKSEDASVETEETGKPLAEDGQEQVVADQMAGQPVICYAGPTHVKGEQKTGDAAELEPEETIESEAQVPAQIAQESQTGTNDQKLSAKTGEKPEGQMAGERTPTGLESVENNVANTQLATADGAVNEGSPIVNAAQVQTGQQVEDLPEDFAQRVFERLIEKFANKQFDNPKVENAQAQFARLAVELSMPIKMDQQVLSSALNLVNNSQKLTNEQVQAAKALVTNQIPQNNIIGASSVATNHATSKAGDKASEVERLPKVFASRTLTRVEEALKEVARTKDGKTISLRLDPPNLGSVRVDVRISDGVLTANLRAENPQVVLLLKEHGFDLQTTLRRIGVNVDEVKVNVSNDFGREPKFKDFSEGNQTKGERERQNWTGAPVVSEELLAQEKKLESSSNTLDHWVA